MNIVEICKMMSWDYHTYRKQPKWMIDHIMARIIGEEKFNKFQNLKYGRK